MKFLSQKVLLFLLSSILWNAHGQGRFAFTVGIDTYDHLGDHAQLKVAVQDAGTIASALRNCSPGFEVVNLEEVTREELSAAFENFSKTAAGADCVVFYFAGHGIEFHGSNYLLLRDTDPVLEARDVIRTKSALELRALSMARILNQLDQIRAKLTIVILDACRDNPLEETVMQFSKNLDGGGSETAHDGVVVKGGIGRLNAPAGTIISYSADIGQTANDGLFTNILAKHIQTPGLPLMQVFTETRKAVGSRSRRMAENGEGVFHEPAEYLKLDPSGLAFRFHEFPGKESRSTESVPESGEAKQIALIRNRIDQARRELADVRGMVERGHAAGKPTPVPSPGEMEFWHFHSPSDFVFEAKLISKTEYAGRVQTVTLQLREGIWVLDPSRLRKPESFEERIGKVPSIDSSVLEKAVAAMFSLENIPGEAIDNLAYGALRAGSFCLSSKDHEGARRIHEGLIRWFSRFPGRKRDLAQAWSQLGRDFEFQKKWPEAKNAYLKSISHGSSHGSRLGLFRSLRELGEIDEAKELLYSIPRSWLSPELFESVGDIEGASRISRLIAEDCLISHRAGKRPFPSRQLSSAIRYSHLAGEGEKAHEFSKQLLESVSGTDINSPTQLKQVVSCMADWWLTCPSSITLNEKLSFWHEFKSMHANRFAGFPRLDWRLARELHEADKKEPIGRYYRLLLGMNQAGELRPDSSRGTLPRFDGKASYLSIPPLPFDECQQFTIEAWVYGWRGRIFGQGRQGDPENSIWASWGLPSQTIGWESGRGSKNNTISKRPFPFHGWEHLAIVFDGREQRAYLNGVLFTSNSPVPSPGQLTAGRRFFIGAQQSWLKDQGPTSLNASGVFHSLRVSSSARYREDRFQPPLSFSSDSATLALIVADGGSRTVRDYSPHSLPVFAHGIEWVVAGRPGKDLGK